MKKVILLVIILIFVFSLSLLLAGMRNKFRGKNIISDRIKELPQFSFVTLEGESFSSDEIKEGPLLIVNFHPECEHCRYEISELLQSNIHKSGIKLMLISYAMPSAVEEFLEICQKPGNETEFITLVDTAIMFGEIFGSSIVPSNYLYNKELILIEALYGEYRIESILNRFNINEHY